ncbi:uncharacterized protein LOC144865849 [Branchiostoma floridae x Branchiostoma japonicum]
MESFKFNQTLGATGVLSTELYRSQEGDYSSSSLTQEKAGLNNDVDSDDSGSSGIGDGSPSDDDEVNRPANPRGMTMGKLTRRMEKLERKAAESRSRGDTNTGEIYRELTRLDDLRTKESQGKLGICVKSHYRESVPRKLRDSLLGGELAKKTDECLAQLVPNMNIKTDVSLLWKRQQEHTLAYDGIIKVSAKELKLADDYVLQLEEGSEGAFERLCGYLVNNKERMAPIAAYLFEKGVFLYDIKRGCIELACRSFNQQSVIHLQEEETIKSLKAMFLSDVFDSALLKQFGLESLELDIKCTFSPAADSEMTCESEEDFIEIVCEEDQEHEAADASNESLDTPSDINIAPSDVTENSISITWAEAAGARVSYEVCISPADGDNPIGKVDDGAPLEYSFTNLTPGTLYTISVTTVGGEVVNAESTVQLRTIPAPPDKTRIVDKNNNSISITWAEAVGIKDHYRVSISPPDGDNPTGRVDDGAPLEHTFTGLTSGTLYTISVTTVSGEVRSAGRTTQQKMSKIPSAVLWLNDKYSTISSIHQQVAKKIREYEPDIPVFSTVLQASEEDIQDAKQDGVELLLPELEPDDPRTASLDWLTSDRVKYPHLPSKVRSIVGHADVTSRAAVRIKKERYRDATVILHTNNIPDDTEYYKGDEEAMGKMEDSILEDAQEADVVFSLGNKAFDHFEDQFRTIPDEKRPRHFNFLPRPSKTFEDAKAEFKKTDTMVVLSIGRVRGVEKLKKGYDLAVESLSIVADRMKVKYRVIGVNKDDVETHKAILEHRKSANLQITLLPYGTQKDICKEMMQAHLVLMPSRAEPFGLVGLEAIAAGVPVLVSSKSGLADFVHEHVDELHHSIVDMDGTDENATVKHWAHAIQRVLKHNRTEFKTAARGKQQLLSSKYWEESHQQFIKACTKADGQTQMWKTAKWGDLTYMKALLSKGTDVNMVDKEGRTLLWIAAEQGHIPTVDMLLSKGADVNMADKNGRTPLWIAAQQGHLLAVEMLLSKGADVNVADKHGRTPLWTTALNGNLRTVEKLLSKGADVNMADKDGRTPLLTAVLKGHLPKVKALLSNGADIHMPSNMGHTSLELALAKGQWETADVLISFGANTKQVDIKTKHVLWQAAHQGLTSLADTAISKGADVNMADKDGRTPLWTAAKEGHLSTVDMLLSKGGNVNKVDKGGRTPLWIAAENDRVPIAEMLLSKGADVTMADKGGRTPLWIAAQEGHLPTVEMLLSKGAKVNMADKDGKNPLWIAAQEGHLPTVEMLLSKGADVNMADKDGKNPLWIAAQEGHLPTVEMLLSKGAEVNMADKDGKNPLWIAAQQGHLPTVEMLLSKGADVNMADKDGKNPLWIAAQKDHLSTVEMLLSKGADVNMADMEGRTPLLAAIEQRTHSISFLFSGRREMDNLPIIEMLLSKGADVNMADKDGRTPLWIAAQKDHLSTVEMLLSKGGNVNMADMEGRTPLWIAAQQDHVHTAEMLLSKGADVNMTDKDGRTPLLAAIEQRTHSISFLFLGRREMDNLPIIEMLLSKGANVNMADKDGRTPLWLAAQQDHVHTVEKLLHKGADINMADKYGQTPLWSAAQQGHLSTVAILLSKGADVNLADKDGRTPIYVAKREGHSAVEEILMKHKIKPIAK